MLHDICADGSIYRLRPVTDGDAAKILELRSNPELNRFLHTTSGMIDDQLAWLAKYYQREGDYYFVVERRSDGCCEGVVALYNIDWSTKTGEWGRWILRSGSLAAVESAYLIYGVAFDRLALEGVYCRTVADNVKVVSFHDSCGITDRKILPRQFELAGGWHDAVEHCVDYAFWLKLRPRLASLVVSAAKRLSRA